MRVLTLLSLTAVVVPFVVRTHILPLFLAMSGKGIFQGYWHNSCNEVVTFNGDTASSNCIQLRNVDTIFNVIAVAYMQSVSEGSIPTFTINPETGMNERNFAAQVIELHTRKYKTAVILSLGGPNSNISLISGQEDDFKNEIIRLAETYGFAGVEVNLERPVLDVADNAYVILAALKDVKYHFDKSRSFNILHPWRTPRFILAMALQVTFRCDEIYRPYLDGLMSDVDYVIMKFFDYDREDILWLEHVNEDLRKRLKKPISSQIILRERPHAYDLMNECFEIPNTKLVYGSLVNNFAGGHPAFTNYLFQRIYHMLSTHYFRYKPLRGLALWSINWETAKYSNGTGVPELSVDLFSDIYRYHLIAPIEGRHIHW